VSAAPCVTSRLLLDKSFHPLLPARVGTQLPPVGSRHATHGRHPPVRDHFRAPRFGSSRVAARVALSRFCRNSFPLPSCREPGAIAEILHDFWARATRSPPTRSDLDGRSGRKNMPLILVETGASGDLQAGWTNHTRSARCSRSPAENRPPHSLRLPGGQSSSALRVHAQIYYQSAISDGRPCIPDLAALPPMCGRPLRPSLFASNSAHITSKAFGWARPEQYLETAGATSSTRRTLFRQTCSWSARPAPFML